MFCGPCILVYLRNKNQQDALFYSQFILIINLYIFLAGLLPIIIQNKQTRWFILEGQISEALWTIAPAIILVFIAIPSLWLLYLIDKIHNPVITLKAVGHQWYWSYEYSDFTKLELDSYIVQQEDQPFDTFRLLDTDNQVVLPTNSPIRIMVTAADVLHSWTVPRLGVKTDSTLATT
jgi:cytochrome c oxidase subunit 2